MPLPQTLHVASAVGPQPPHAPRRARCCLCPGRPPTRVWAGPHRARSIGPPAPQPARTHGRGWPAALGEHPQDSGSRYHHQKTPPHRHTGMSSQVNGTPDSAHEHLEGAAAAPHDAATEGRAPRAGLSCATQLLAATACPTWLHGCQTLPMTSGRWVSRPQPRGRGGHNGPAGTSSGPAPRPPPHPWPRRQPQLIGREKRGHPDPPAPSVGSTVGRPWKDTHVTRAGGCSLGIWVGGRPSRIANPQYHTD